MPNLNPTLPNLLRAKMKMRFVAFERVGEIKIEKPFLEKFNP